MPLPAENAYWDRIASRCISMTGREVSFSDNSYKRPNQVKHLLRYDWVGHKILEIGTGNGIIGGILHLLTGSDFAYTGTELSEQFRRFSKNVFQLDTVNADVRELPGNGYSRIIAFDSLEHVRPEHREEGYRKIFEVAALGAKLFIHYSYGVSVHDKDFDHPFGLFDLECIEAAGFTLMTYDRTTCAHPAGPIDYAFVTFSK